MKQEKGEKVIEVEQAIEKMVFNSVKLTDCKKIKCINHGQLLTNIVNKMKTHLIPEAAEEGGRNAAAIQTVMSEICVLDTSKWSEEIPLNFGRSQIKSLCHQFYMTQAINTTIIAFEDFLNNGGKKSVPADLETLLNCIKVIPCSLAECKRGFSAMNNILDNSRLLLLIQRVSNLIFIKLHDLR